MKTKLNKFASDWSLSEADAMSLLRTQGLSEINLQKLAVVAGPAPGGSSMDQGGTAVSSAQQPQQAAMNNNIAVPNTSVPEPPKTNVASGMGTMKSAGVFANLARAAKTNIASGVDKAKTFLTESPTSHSVSITTKDENDWSLGRQGERMDTYKNSPSVASEAGSKLRSALPYAALALGTTAVLGAAHGVGNMVHEARENKKKNENLAAIQTEYPELKEHNPDRLKAYHNLIYKNAPEEFRHPKLIGAEIKRHLNYSSEGIPLGAVKDMVDIKAKSTQIKKDQSGQGSSVGNLLSGLGFK